MASKLGIWRQKIQQHPFITMGIIVLLMAFLAFALAVHWFGLDWTGFNGGYHKISIATDIKPPPQKTTKTEEQQPVKTFWDWLLLLAAVAIPVVAGFGAAWFTAQHGKVSERENRDNQREKALQDYIDKMSELLLDKDNPLRESKPEDEVRTIARVRTITILSQLDARRIGYVFTFLREAELMSNELASSIVSLRQADLRKINWGQADLREANFMDADLTGATISQADLSKSDLSGANLSEATLSRADISGANLGRASVSDATTFAVSLNVANLSKPAQHLVDICDSHFLDKNGKPVKDQNEDRRWSWPLRNNGTMNNNKQ
jgi:hypothetical protein